MKLDFSPLGSAITQLETSLKYAHSDLAKTDPGLFVQLRNSVIQCFEFTYELSHKMLKRYLEETAASPEEIDLSTFQNMIRMGNEKGLLRSDWTMWRTYRQARIDSSHTYNEEKAEAGQPPKPSATPTPVRCRNVFNLYPPNNSRACRRNDDARRPMQRAGNC